MARELGLSLHGSLGLVAQDHAARLQRPRFHERQLHPLRTEFEQRIPSAQNDRSIPTDFDCSIDNCSSSSPQTYSCQSMSQLFGPSKKPSSVTIFHMMSFLMRIRPPD